jgi:glutamate 5-kinase
VQAYEAAFAPAGYLCAQILLSHDDVKSRDRYLNARATLQDLAVSRCYSPLLMKTIPS